MKDGEEYFIGRVALKAIIMSPRGRVLVCRNVRDADLWDLPGGTLNVGEEPESALLREIREELSLTPQIAAPIKATTFIKPTTGMPVFVLIYRAVLSEEPKQFVLDETEIAEARWISPEVLQTIRLFPEYHRELEKLFELGDK
jgi:mutator protein MutT